MNEPLDVRENAWIDAFTVFRKANLDAWAVYNNAIADADTDASSGKVYAYARTLYRDCAVFDVRAIYKKARAIFEKAKAEAYAKANAVRDNVVAEARVILEKARANADYEKALAEAEKNKNK